MSLSNIEKQENIYELTTIWTQGNSSVENQNVCFKLGQTQNSVLEQRVDFIEKDDMLLCSWLFVTSYDDDRSHQVSSRQV